MTIKLHFPFDARTSWHGYSYQGKLTIYMVINKILDEIESIKSHFTEDKLIERLRSIQVEVEFTEDIAFIKTLDSGEERYTDIYQVKAGQSTKLSAEDSFNLYAAGYMHKQKYDEEKGKYCYPKCFLVTAKDLQDQSEIKLLAQNKQLALIDSFPKEIKVSDVSSSKSKATVLQIIKQSIPVEELPEKTIDQATLNDVLSTLEDYLTVIEQIDVSVYPKIFSNEKDVIEASVGIIDNLRQSEISQQMNSNIWKKTSKQLFYCMHRILEVHLFDKNSLKKRVKFKLSLDLFYQEMAMPLTDNELSSMYVHYEIKDILFKSFDKFPPYFNKLVNNTTDFHSICPSDTKNCLECEINEQCHFFEFYSDLHSLHVEDLHDLITKLSIKKVNNFDQMNELPTTADILGGFYSFVKEYPEFQRDNLHFYNIDTDDRKNVWLTLNNLGYVHEIEESINDFIKEDVSMIERMFETDILLHQKIQCEKMNINNIKFIALEEDQLKELDKYQNEELFKEKMNTSKEIMIINSRGWRNRL